MAFRFQNLEVWQRAAEFSPVLFGIGDHLEIKRRFRWAEQLRGAALSITNNIAEGSGSFSDAEFAQFLNISRRSVFECANILIIMERKGALPEDPSAHIGELDQISRMITQLRRSLL
jgi:four helix bundle protein